MSMGSDLNIYFKKRDDCAGTGTVISYSLILIKRSSASKSYRFFIFLPKQTIAAINIVAV